MARPIALPHRRRVGFMVNRSLYNFDPDGLCRWDEARSSTSHPHCYPAIAFGVHDPAIFSLRPKNQYLYRDDRSPSLPELLLLYRGHFTVVLGN